MAGCWRHVSPSVLTQDLEDSDFNLENYGHDGRFRLGAGRVIVAEYDLSLVALYICQVARFEPKSFREQLEQGVPQTLHLVGIVKQRIAEN